MKRDILINVLGTLVAAPILFGLTTLFARLSEEGGTYLTVTQSAEAYGGVTLVTIQVENSGSIGLAPVEARFPTGSGLLAIGARGSGAAEPVLTPEFAQWSGRLPAKSIVMFVLVFKGPAPAIDAQTAFSAQFASKDQQGFVVAASARIRSGTEATAARLLLLAKWLGTILGLFLVVSGIRWGSRYFAKAKTA